VAKIIPNERRGEGTGYYALSVVLSAAFGPFLAMLFTQHTGIMSNFVLCAILLVVSFIAIFFLKVPKILFVKNGTKNRKGFSFDVNVKLMLIITINLRMILILNVISHY
jgi:MFS family permease